MVAALAMLGLVTGGPAPPSLPPSLGTTLLLSNPLLDALGLSPDLQHNLDQACGSYVCAVAVQRLTWLAVVQPCSCCS